MTNQEILDIALRQSAADCNCMPSDFLKNEPVVVLSRKNADARAYLPLPLECDLVSYGNNIVAQVSERTVEIVDDYIRKYPAHHCFETPNLHVLDEKLSPFGLKICFMAEYFLPDINHLHAQPCEYELRLLTPPDFEELYTEKWNNALSRDRRERDILALGAYDGKKLIGLAGCSADCESMAQIGIDVLPDYRKQGVATSLTSRLALEILDREKVPFYCAAWSNIRSVRTAIRSGFRPAWVELTARERTFVEQMNKISLP